MCDTFGRADKTGAHLNRLSAECQSGDQSPPVCDAARRYNRRFDCIDNLGTSGKVVISPICPPDSMPSATKASTPSLSSRMARATLDTTGISLFPPVLIRHIGAGVAGAESDYWHLLITKTFILSLRKGDITIIFTAKGLSVISLTCRICSLSQMDAHARCRSFPNPLRLKRRRPVRTCRARPFRPG